MASATFADEVVNNIDASIDATLEAMPLAAGASGSTILSIVPKNSDGKNGCNLTGSTTLKIAAASSNSAVATATLVHPTTVPTTAKDTFTSCDDTIKVNVAALTAGSTNITFSEVTNDTSGTFDFAPAAFSVSVTASDSTPPTISYVLNPATADGDLGWYKSNVTLTWTVTENESASSLVKDGCVDQDITADQAETTYSCSASSDGGSAGPVNVSIKRDGTAPTAEYTPPASGTGANAAGWYTSTASRTGLLGMTGCPPARAA